MQPQCMRGQVARSEASIASLRKYSSQDGRRLQHSPMLFLALAAQLPF